MGTKDFSVRVGQEEIGQILNLKENLDHHGHLWSLMSGYRDLGWELAVLTPQGADLGLDLRQPQGLWWQQLAEMGLDGIQVNLAVRSGRPSQLLVLEVNRGGGSLSLDLLGDWRARCVAQLGSGREQHYYALSPESPSPPSHFTAPDVLIYGEEGLVLAPPSVELGAREPWQWLTPPWESPPQPPPPAVWRFLREQTGVAGPAEPEAASWEEKYPAFSPFESLLEALLLPPTDLAQHYRNLLQGGLVMGLGDRQLLMGLLRYAPLADAHPNGQRWRQPQNLLTHEDPPGAGHLEELLGAVAMFPYRRKVRELQEVKTIIQDFFYKNPDLADEQIRVQMLVFSLRNYVSINPEYAGLSLRDKLEMAGQMARSFLNEPARPQAGGSLGADNG